MPSHPPAFQSFPAERKTRGADSPAWHPGFRQLVQTQVDSLPKGIHRRNVVDNRNQQILRIAAGRRVGRTVEKLLKQCWRNVFALIVPYGAASLEQRIQLAGLRDIARKRRAIRGGSPHYGNSPRRADRKAVLTADTSPSSTITGSHVHAESLDADNALTQAPHETHRDSSTLKSIMIASLRFFLPGIAYLPFFARAHLS